MTMDNTSALYPIRAICEMTGVNPVTLRAWERRYGLIKPERTAKGHRLYSEKDVATIHNVLSLLEKGIPVSQVSTHLDTVVSMSVQARVEETIDYWHVAKQRMLNAVIRFDTQRLDTAYSEALSLYPVAVVTECLLMPLLKILGERWGDVEAGIAEEHFFSTYLRNKLGARMHHLSTRVQGGPRIIAACLPNEPHEIGLILFSIMAMEHGCNIVLLGASMPIEQVKYAAQRADASAIVLSGDRFVKDESIQGKLSGLVTETGLPVFVGGRAAIEGSHSIRQAGAHPLGLPIPNAVAHVLEYIERSTE